MAYSFKEIKGEVKMQPHKTNMFGEETIFNKRVIFLNKENLEKLSGYKATIGFNTDNEIVIRITGFKSFVSAEKLINTLKIMKPEEINGE